MDAFGAVSRSYWINIEFSLSFVYRIHSGTSFASCSVNRDGINRAVTRAPRVTSRYTWAQLIAPEFYMTRSRDYVSTRRRESDASRDPLRENVRREPNRVEWYTYMHTYIHGESWYLLFVMQIVFRVNNSRWLTSNVHAYKDTSEPRVATRRGRAAMRYHRGRRDVTFHDISARMWVFRSSIELIARARG